MYLFKQFYGHSTELPRKFKGKMEKMLGDDSVVVLRVAPSFLFLFFIFSVCWIITILVD